jgi:hypothetical protein
LRPDSFSTKWVLSSLGTIHSIAVAAEAGNKRAMKRNVDFITALGLEGECIDALMIVMLIY